MRVEARSPGTITENAPESAVKLPTEIDTAPLELPPRSVVVSSRVVRDSALIRQLKLLHRDRCQICGEALQTNDGRTYSEGHHLRPIGEPHNGPDIASNILILCPNHHALCDLGGLTVTLGDLATTSEHYPAAEFISYHNTILVGQNSPQVE
jgi:predicted restriction endonuclease